jgi:hypothetical protein
VREILFRGKRKDNGEWVYGFYRSYIYRKKKHAWLETIDRTWEIKPETVGQFTGLTDKNGVRIFEGDIIFIFGHGHKKVVFSDGCFRSSPWNTTEVTLMHFIDKYNMISADVVGNIHDTPELLSGEGT